MEIHTISAGQVQRVGNVLKIVYSKETIITVEDMMEITPIRQKLFADDKYCTLVDLTQDFLSLSSEAKKYVSENKTIKERRIAEVLLVKNFAQKLGVGAYVKMFRSNDTIAVMTNEENAIQWLEGQHSTYLDSVLSQLKNPPRHC